MAVQERLAFLLSLDADQAIKGFNKVGDAADKSLSKADERMKKASLSLTSFGTKALAVAGVAAVGLAKTAGAFADLANAAGKFSDAAGISVEEASRLIAVGDDLNISAETMQGSFLKLNKAVATGADSIKEYGIEVARTDDGVVDANQTFLNAIDVVGRIEDPTKRAQAAQELFGRSYGEIAELIETGATDVRTALDSVSEAQVISPAELEKARAYRAAMDELGDSFSDLVVSIGQGVAPAISGLATGVAGLINFFGRADAVTGGLVGKLAGFGVAGLAAAGSISFVAGKVLGMVDNFQRMSASMRNAEGGLSRMGKVGVASMGALGVVTAAFAVAQFSANQEAQKGAKYLDDLASESDAQVMHLVELGIILRTFSFDKLAEGSLGAAIRIRDLALANDEFAASLAEAGISTSDMTASIDAQVAAQERAATTAGIAAAATDDLGGAADGALPPIVDLGDATIRTAKSYEKLKTSVDILNDALSNRDAEDEAIAAHNELIWANQIAIDTARNHKATEEERATALDASKEALRRSIDATIAYIDTLGGIPKSKATAIATLIDEGQFAEVERRLAILARNRAMTISIETKGGPGYSPDPQFAMGGNASGWSMVGERGPELVKLPVGSQVRSNAQLRADMSGAQDRTIPQLRAELSGASGSTTIYNTINVATLTGKLPPETVRQIEDALAASARLNGRSG